MNHYPRHIGDWMRDTAHLSEVEECIYSRLIDMYYSREKALPVDEEQCCRLVRATSKQAKAAVASVLREFFALQDDGWHQKRCDQELGRYREKSAKASASASTRWSERNANAMRTHSEGNANHKPITNNQKKPKTSAQQAAPVGVRPEVWEEWRRFRGKLSDYMIRLQAKQLTDIGGDPNAVIEQSIRNGWKGLFPLKTASTGPPQSVHDKRTATARAMFGETKNEPVDITTESRRIA